MRWLAVSYLVCCMASSLITWMLYTQNQNLQAQKTDLIWRNVSVAQRIDPHQFKGLDADAAYKAHSLTGLPFEIIAAGREVENGGIGYEMGYRGKSELIVHCFEPDEWQYGEFARRMNQFAWEYIKADRQCFKECTEYMAKRYTGKQGHEIREYAKKLRGAK